ncbi:MAG: hypothetical protein ACLFMZ_03560 [Spirochaetaceae bacterium]
MKQKKTMTFIFSLLFISSLLPAGAETVMIYTDKEKGEGDVEMSRGYLEDGVMETFFDAGHIVFNAYPEMAEDATQPDGFSEKFSVRAAKAGGASLLLEIFIKFDANEENKLPYSASYSLYELKTGELLAHGEEDLPDKDDEKELGKEERLHRLGSAVASRVLEKK